MSTGTPVESLTPAELQPASNSEMIPPLENGDRLTRAEFYRRWKAMPDLKCAERIEGIVYMAAAVGRKKHGQPHSHFVTWLGSYHSETPGMDVGDNATAQLDPDNDPQPDSYLLILPECGGQCRFTEDDYISGGPEFIGEIAASSASRDPYQKFQVYRRSGVKEYVVWKHWKRRSSGSACRTTSMLRSNRRTASSRARSFRVCGSMWMRCSEAISRQSSQLSRKELPHKHILNSSNN